MLAVVVLGLIIAGAVASGVFAVESRKQAREALEQRNLAQEQRAEAEKQKNEAERQKAEAELQAELSGKLTTTARTLAGTGFGGGGGGGSCDFSFISNFCVALIAVIGRMNQSVGL